jgi:hypothetical protein
MRDLDVDEMWRVERLAGGEQSPLDRRGDGRAQEHLEDGRGVDDDHG